MFKYIGINCVSKELGVKSFGYLGIISKGESEFQSESEI